VAGTFRNRFEQDNNNRLYFAPKKNEVFGTTTASKNAYWGYRIPNNSSRQIVGMQFDFDLQASANWTLTLQRRSASWGGLSTEWSVSASGVDSAFFTFTACDAVTFRFFKNAADATYTGETGDEYAKITNIRLVTSTANAVDTTTSTTITAGADRVVTPANMNNIYVGQRLVINNGSTTSESVIVKVITSTTFTADFTQGYSGTTPVQAHVVYADEIIKDLVAHVTAVNPAQLSADTSLIESPGLDLLDESYEDEYPADIATKLAGLGDNQTPPRRWEVGVWEDRRLHFRPKGSGGRTWFVDADEIELASTLETLQNSAYGVYQDANNRTLRTAVADDANSQARYGIARRRAVAASTTSATQAGVVRSLSVEDGRVIKPRAAVKFEYLTDRSGAIYPKWLLRAGDTLALVNLPAAANEEIDRVRTFVVAERTYDAIVDDVTAVPEEPLTSLEFLVARRSEGFS